MKSIDRFIVLVESRIRHGLFGIASMLLLAAALCLPLPGFSQTSAPSGKVASDLREALSGGPVRGKSWVREIGGTRYVKALIVSNSSDPELTDLRAQVMASGGSVYYRYL